MKLLLIICFSIIALTGFSQSVIKSFNLSVCYQKTTNLIFPYRIEKADIGSSDVIGYKDGILNNVLFLKAGRKGFIPTNLSVYTSDGKLYSFLVQYKENSDTLNLLFPKNDSIVPTVSDTVNNLNLDSDAYNILNHSNFLRRTINDQEMKLILQGIYIHDHLMWFKLKLENNSDIDFENENIRFSIKDKHSGKRTAVQETDLSPVWQNSDQNVFGQSERDFVSAFPAFTINKHKKLLIQVREKNGGRQLILEIPARIILKSQSI